MTQAGDDTSPSASAGGLAGDAAARGAGGTYRLAEHGADGSVENDNAAMKRALAYAKDNPGTRIVLPSGTTRLDSTANDAFCIPSRTTIEGEDAIASVVSWNEATGCHLFTTEQGTQSADIRIQNFTLRGSWDPATGMLGVASGSPVFLVAVDGVTLSNLTSERTRGFGLCVRASTEVAVTGCVVRHTATDGINLSECSNVSVTGCRISHIGDDAISVHSDVFDTFGVRRNLLISGNHIFDAQGIRVLAARQTVISGNMLDTVLQLGINVQTVAPDGSQVQEGVSATHSVTICGNTITNLIRRDNVDGLNNGADGILIDGFSGRAGNAGAAPGETGPDAGAVRDPYGDFLANSTSPAVPTAGAYAIVVSGNRIDRTLPACDGTDPRFKTFSDYRQGTLASKRGTQDPSLSENDLRNNGVRIEGGFVRDVLIVGNGFSGLYAALVLSGSGHFGDIGFRANHVTDMSGFGVLVNGDMTMNAYVEHNLFDLDPFFISASRGSNGTWSNNAGPMALYVNQGRGLVFRGNTVRNCCFGTNIDPSDPGSGFLIENNVVEADPVEVNAFSIANKGVGLVHSAGFRLAHVDSDPASPSYDTILTVPVEAAPAMPQVGTWMQGAFVRNSAPSPENPALGWLRLTTGTGHVPGTDWLAK